MQAVDVSKSKINQDAENLWTDSLIKDDEEVLGEKPKEKGGEASLSTSIPRRGSQSLQ
jgi:hypothetical protein